MKILFAYLAVASILTLGLVSIFRPTVVQSFASRHNKLWLPGIQNPFYEWMKTSEYLVMVRIVGGFLILLALGLAYALSLVVFR
jgi:hypothetical protein